MRKYLYEENAQRTDSKGDVDDLIFCAGPDWSASDR